MSSSLIWEPVIEQDGRSLPCGLKSALRKRFGDPVDVTLSGSDRNYLEGLSDAGLDGSSGILSAIDKHGMIKVKEVW